MNRVTNSSPITGLREVNPSWKRGLVLVCRSCDGDGKALRRGLKDALAQAGLRKRVRVVACGCLDVCPKHATAVVTIGEGVLECKIVRDADARTLDPIVSRFESRAPEIHQNGVLGGHTTTENR